MNKLIVLLSVLIFRSILPNSCTLERCRAQELFRSTPDNAFSSKNTKKFFGDRDEIIKKHLLSQSNSSNLVKKVNQTDMKGFVDGATAELLEYQNKNKEDENYYNVFFRYSDCCRKKKAFAAKAKELLEQDGNPFKDAVLIQLQDRCEDYNKEILELRNQLGGGEIKPFETDDANFEASYFEHLLKQSQYTKNPQLVAYLSAQHKKNVLSLRKLLLQYAENDFVFFDGKSSQQEEVFQQIQDVYKLVCSYTEKCKVNLNWTLRFCKESKRLLFTDSVCAVDIQARKSHNFFDEDGSFSFTENILEIPVIFTYKRIKLFKNNFGFDAELAVKKVCEISQAQKAAAENQEPASQQVAMSRTGSDTDLEVQSILANNNSLTKENLARLDVQGLRKDTASDAPTPNSDVPTHRSSDGFSARSCLKSSRSTSSLDSGSSSARKSVRFALK